ncbi:hypothetical protein GSF67_20585 [Agrobacterium sp. CGMCC 11546]|nr:hypothetical protein GSF67_20585 [Agrobacterium sp. CGMCC 11546]
MKFRVNPGPSPDHFFVDSYFSMLPGMAFLYCCHCNGGTIAYYPDWYVCHALLHKGRCGQNRDVPFNSPKS